MFTLIFAILSFIVLVVKIYETIKYKEKPDNKTILYMILVSLLIVSVFLEKVLKAPI